MSIIEVERCSLLVFTALLPASPSINAETITSLADSLYCFLDFWHDNYTKVILTELAINCQLIGTVHDLVEVAA